MVLARFVLIPFLGWGAAKCGAVGSRARRGLSFLLVNVCYPVMILANIWPRDFRLLWAQSAFTIVFAAGLTGLLFAAGKLWFRRRASDNPALWNFMLGIGNVSYIGVPILHMFFGSGAVTLAIVYSSVADLFIWLLYYPMVLAGDRRPLREVLLNPCLIALLLSLVLSVAKTPVPAVLIPVFKVSTTVVSVVALFYVGLALAGARFKEIFKNPLPWRFSAVKVAALPALCFVALLPFTGAERAAVLAILAGSPTPLLAMVWTRGQPAAQRQAVECFVASTLLFLAVVIPLCMLLRFPGSG